MSRRLPVIGFGLLALATVGAFFLIQALKTAPPLLWGSLRSIPAAINPLTGRTCQSSNKQHTLINYADTKLTLALSHTDSVGVYIVDARYPNGSPVDTLSSGTQMTGVANGALAAQVSKVFTWNGELTDGGVATSGTYYFRIVLNEEDRSINLSGDPIQVLTQPRTPRVLNVRLVGTGATSSTTTGTTTTGTVTTVTTDTTGTTTGTSTTVTAATTTGPALLSPPHGAVKIDFTPGHYRRAWIYIYRTDVAGKPEYVTHLTVHNLKHNWAFWNGKVGGQPAPAGTYLARIKIQDPACNVAQWPVVLPPAPNTTPRAGVSIRYLTVTPPLTPTVSGSRTRVAVSSRTAGYTWKLRRAGGRKVLAHGSGPAGSSVIHVRMPRHRAGLYTLTVRAGTQLSTVPLVASQAGAAAASARVLVVVPMLTWMGNSPVDDTGDGLPDTLRRGDPVSLNRPLVGGPPVSFGSDATLLRYLDSMHLSYQLTTDVALAEDRGPSLVDRWGVLFPGGEEFLPAGLGATLSGFVKGGGRVAALGTGTLQGVSRITGFPTDTRASAPVLSRVDAFGAQHGSITPTSGELITELTDALGVLNGAIAFSGFNQYQPIQPPSGATISAAGIASGSPAIIAFRDGTGTVIEVGLPNFSASLAHNVDSQELLTNTWHVLAKDR